jgi:hypothetical protein
MERATGQRKNEREGEEIGLGAFTVTSLEIKTQRQ